MSRLIPCPDCGKDVSMAAASCPNCGRPFAWAGSTIYGKSPGSAKDRPTRPWKMLQIVSFLGVVATGVVWLATKQELASYALMAFVALFLLGAFGVWWETD